MKKRLSEMILNACGLYWWPPTHSDLRINGPQPRIVTRKQYEYLMKVRNDTQGEDGGHVKGIGEPPISAAQSPL